ncbi:MarR family winged helix-turn-helix transcriptional regulator [Flavicella marina]|uniref:MarR family winged helix-turn-helix transcriptional regulator n=1 Tax=Flavicella marina TaxID=1475951 RepID=UPI001264B62E|nr:MarR family transcriptional regulator [Flavicella marina]
MLVEKQLNQESKLNSFTKVILNLMYTGNWVNEKSSEFFKLYDLTSQQFNVLRILRGQKGKPINLQDIQLHMISRMSNTTRLIEKLRIKGFVNRVACETNRRKIEITITPEGLDLLATIDEPIKTHEQKVTESLTEHEANQLNILLNKLRTNNK